ncbi:MAG: YraN family protein [Pseudomonadota bacterium]
MNANSRKNRKAAEARGRQAEWLACALYLSRGFTVVERRYKTRVGEIDLILKRGRTFVFCEVKARRHMDDAVNAVDTRTRRRIEQASRNFLARAKDAERCAVRFDICAVVGWRPRIVHDAWREGD